MLVLRMANDESSHQLSEYEMDVGPAPPKLILHSSNKVSKVGENVMLELRNIAPEQDIQVTIEPLGMCDMCKDPNPSETTKRYKLVPQKYGVCRVTVKIGSLKLTERLRVHPMGKLKMTVTGHPHNAQRQPCDVLVDDKHLIIAEGELRRVIRMTTDGTEQEEYTVPLCENFYPIGLAMKKNECEESNELYVTDISNGCVHVFHWPVGRYSESFGSDVLKRPTGIAIDKDGYIFVADHEAKRIFQFTPNHYEPVKNESPHELAGPQLMTIHRGTLFVADRRGSKISVFRIEPQSEHDVVKELTYVTDLYITTYAESNHVMPFSVACDPDGHIFITGQVSFTNSSDQRGKKKGFIWFKDSHRLQFYGFDKVDDWPFGHGLRNPGGMRIVDEGGSRYLYVTDMRGENANTCINKYLL